MSNMIYFTADTHFGHNNIIRYCKRPFANADEMDAVLIKNWNRVVSPNADVYHLGDFAWLKGKTFSDKVRDVERICGRLNGRIHLVFGNHDDRDALRNSGCFERTHDRMEIKYAKQNIVLDHYAMRVWNRSHFGAWQLYGHTHDVIDDWYLSTDVGVDAWDYTPVSFEQLKEHFKSREAWTHFDKLGENFNASEEVPS